MILLKQLAQTYRGIFFVIFLILSESATTLYAQCSNAETLAKYWLSTAWWNEALVLRGHDNFCSTFEYLQFKIVGMTAPLTPS